MKYVAIAANAIVLALVGSLIVTNGIPGDQETRILAAVVAATILSMVVLLRHRSEGAKYEKWLEVQEKKLRRELAESH
jgi:hypothetical protein